MDLRTLCQRTRSEARTITDLIIDRWSQIASSEPWLSLPEDLDHDHLPELIELLADAALCTDFEPRRCHEVARVAAEHGHHRARQGFAENLIHREYHLLRRALAERLSAVEGERSIVYLGVMRMDAVASLAGSAALHGLYRERLEEEGRWPDAVDELVEDWPLPRG